MKRNLPDFLQQSYSTKLIISTASSTHDACSNNKENSIKPPKTPRAKRSWRNYHYPSFFWLIPTILRSCLKKTPKTFWSYSCYHYAPYTRRETHEADAIGS